MSGVTLVALRELGEWSGGNTPPKANAAYWSDGTVPWVSPKDMKVDEITGSEDAISEVALEEGRVALLPSDSVLIVTRSGILAHTLPVAVTKLPVTINQDLKALRPKPGVFSKYVAHALRGASRTILNRCSKHGTTVASVDTNALLDFKIPMVDIDAQHAIVAEIEKQFSRLDEAVASVKRVKANLERYKAAVLKAAVEGRLVEAEAVVAHREGRDYETGTELLRGILDKRRRGWRTRTRYEEPRGSACSGPLPAGWAWATVEQLNPADRPCAYGVLQPGEHVEGGVPFVRVGDVKDGRIERSEMKCIDVDIAAAYPRTRLRGGEVVLTLVGAIGRTAVVPASLAGGNVARAVGVLPVAPDLNATWVEVWFRNPAKIAEMTSKSHEVARKTLNLEDVRFADVALPPLGEQRRIVAEVDRRLSIVRELEAEVDANLKRAQALRQATLAKAFSGGHA
ncbi:restriction endonuclease subunit S [Ramlibacter sp.]|uniref:restriction endonuclease subunit S n=1 Tax=Ramlibacter sp. TaxID=1917967 RepID=UPI002B7F9AB0|nr:restriction endonuclease subunit S [Ramlibacter sp.]HWI81741.1 restriction endonuclease subunit S [Ramlibacter sp.]